MDRLPKIIELSSSLTPAPVSGIYEPPLASYVIANEVLVHPSTDPASEVLAHLIKDTPVLLLAFEGDWVKFQSSAPENISGWALRLAFAMDTPKPAPIATDSTPTPTMLMTSALTTTPSVIMTAVGTPSLTQTVTITVTPRPAITSTLQPTATLIPPLEPTLPMPILADAVVQASTLKLRSGPSENFDDEGTIVQNTMLSVIGQALDCAWLNVVTPDGATGWVPTAAVTLNTDCTQIPVAPLPSTPSAQPGQTLRSQSQGANASNSNPAAGQTGLGQSSDSSLNTSSAQSEEKSDLVATAFVIRNIAENTITFDYTIANQGTIPVTLTAQSQPLGVAIHVFLSDSQGNKLFQGQTLYPPTLKDLAPGQSYSYSYPGTFPSTTRFNPNGTLHLTLVVDAENVVDESNENNNQLITLPLPITPTPTSQPTNTPTLTTTSSPTPLSMNTPMPTAIATQTLIPALLTTPTLTSVSVPTRIATYTPTTTPTPVTNTSTETPIPTLLLTYVPTPTLAPTNIATPITTVTPTSLPTRDNLAIKLVAVNDSPANSPKKVGEPITLTAIVTEGSANGLAFYWSFGDGQTQQGQVVTHVYAQEGTYSAFVIATDGVHGQSATTMIVINPPLGPDEWDQRLTQRGASFVLIDPEPEQGYWRLVTARWLDAVESQGHHHIFIEILDKTGKRQTGVPITITWNDGAVTIISEAKPGEPWAANFPMFALAPLYAAQPQEAPADTVTGMGLGSLEEPNLGHHTSYSLTWQWVEVEEVLP